MRERARWALLLITFAFGCDASSAPGADGSVEQPPVDASVGADAALHDGGRPPDGGRTLPDDGGDGPLADSGTPPVDDECAVTLTEGFDTARPTWGVARPAVRERFHDENYGTCIMRVTDSNDGADGPNPPSWIRHEYSRRPAYNANSTRAIMQSSNGWWHVYSVPEWDHLEQMEVSLSEPNWHPTDPHLLWYLPSQGRGASLHEYDTRTGEQRVLADLLPELREVWPSAARGWTRGEGRPSRDGDIITWLIEDDDASILGIAVFDLSRPEGDRVIGTMSTDDRPDHCSTAPSGRFAVVSWLDGTIAFSIDRDAGAVDFDDGRLLHGASEHSDLARGPEGEDVYVYYDYAVGEIAMVDIATGTRTALVPIYGPSSSAFGGHVSGGAFDVPGWVVISTYRCTLDHGSRACEPGELWGDDKLAVVELREGGRVYSLAHMHNGGGDYFAEPHATVNRDLTRILFASRWESSSAEVSSYEVVLPPGTFGP